MKNLISVVLFLFSLSAFAQSGWFQQSSGTTKDIVDIQFLNNNTGYAIAKDHETGDCAVLKSVNSGNTWVSVFNPSPTILNALCFINENTGSVCGGNGTHVFKTTNGGAAWIPQYTPTDDTYRRIYYQNSDTVYAVSFAAIARTTNSGINWVTMYDVNEAFWSDIIFINQKTGITVGGSNVRTTNSGVNWFVSGFSGVGVSNYGENNIMFCGYNGIYKSTNYGASSTQVYSFPSGDPGALYCIKYLDASTVISGGSSGKILKTTNNGTNWFAQQSNVTDNLFRISFINPQTGWIGGAYGIMLKTTTGGVVTGFSQTSFEIPDKFSLSQNYPNPFNPVTYIKYALSLHDLVTLKVYDAKGKEVAELVNEIQEPGAYSIKFDAENLPSGVYYYKLIANQFQETRKMVLVK